MLNTSNQNFVQNDDSENDLDVKRKKRDLEREIVMQVDDRKKILARKVQIEAEIRALKKDESRIKVDIQVKQAQLEKDDQEMAKADVVIQNLKKKVNLM